ncbi:MAG: hypothetical protein A2113_00110 [Candidatus Woykebacteria bacterium GWA1_44_8]|uniref:BioF2-like acetyltransferase domain-containing protein n=1 Tax=Candidatus Woykebacteria bacterium GWA1_44_8 TaxID=1802591 RepID=A0A1G1W0U7_9BACT|nr:MAG: hypothetical protein A2113_00110 [Candidatus Woykebacteria bacterium GWA1_44_8]
MDIRQSKLWSKYLQELGWTFEKLTSDSFAYTRKIPFLGAVIKIPRLPLPIPFKKIEEVAVVQNAFLVKLEPKIETKETDTDKILSLLKENGFTKDRWSLNPTTTIQIDLTKSEEELLRYMEKDTRYSVRLASRRGVIVKETNDFEQFKNLYFETAERKKFWPAKKELEAVWKVFSKEKSATILTAFYQEKPLASTLLLYINRGLLGARATQDATRLPTPEDAGYGEQGIPKLLNEDKSFSYVASYYHAASLPIHRDVMAPYLLLWEAIKFLKKKGCYTFDLEGIYDPRIPTTKRWKGFTLFKKGFGGRKVEYLGSFTKYYKLWAQALFLPTRFF